MVADFEGLTEGAGDVALDPTLLPQSEGTALRGVLLPELESFKFAHSVLVGLDATPGDCEGLPTGLPDGLATTALGSSTFRSRDSVFASAITCGGTIVDELATASSLSELGLSGIPWSAWTRGPPQSGADSSSLLVSTADTSTGAEVERACLSSALALANSSAALSTSLIILVAPWSPSSEAPQNSHLPALPRGQQQELLALQFPPTGRPQ